MLGMQTEMQMGLHVNYPLRLPNFTKTEMHQQLFIKLSSTKLHKNSFVYCKTVTCIWTDR